MRAYRRYSECWGAAALVVTVVLAGSTAGAPKDDKGDKKPAPAELASLSVSTQPLFLGGILEPNIMLTLDDSSSMGWSFYPDRFVTLAGFGKAKWNLAVDANPLAYDPNYTYPLPADAYGEDLVNTPGGKVITSFTASPPDGYRAWAGTLTPSSCAFDLSGASAPAKDFRPTWQIQDDDLCAGGSGAGFVDLSAVPLTPEEQTIRDSGAAFYAERAAGRAGCDDLTETLYDDNCYTLVALDQGSESQKRNFAIWNSFYRTRLLAAKGGLGNAVAQLGTASRVGLALASADPRVIRGVRLHAGDSRMALLEQLYGAAVSASGLSPLRSALRDVGQYFRGEDASDNPWRTDPEDEDSAMLACRQSYNFLISDGLWTDTGTLGFGNVDGTNGTNGAGKPIAASDPFRDGFGDTLADIARYYWQIDLQPDDDEMADRVPPNSIDPATWQHLVTFAVGLGVEGDAFFTKTTDVPSIIDAAAPVAWPDPIAIGPDGVRGTDDDLPPDTPDDFLHAAVNSYGGYISSNGPYRLDGIFRSALRVGGGRASSAASVVLNAATLVGGTRLYQALFNSENWTGQLLAYEIVPVGDKYGREEGSIGIELWDAGTKIPDADERNIFIFDAGSTNNVDVFAWGNLSDAQKLALRESYSQTWSTLPTGERDLLDEELVGYLRGDNTNTKANEGRFRNRVILLGDIVNSAPAYVGTPSAPYGVIPCDGFTNKGECIPSDESVEGNSYADFRYAQQQLNNGAGRRAMLYVGANDGMLHAFDATTGVEHYAFVPSTVLGKMGALASPSYTHAYFVDGSPTVMDAFFGGKWHTVLIGGLGGGGQGVYALDVTDPEDGARVLWEFSDKSGVDGDGKNTDLGFTFSRPNVNRLIDGRWVAIFGNGYDNTDADGAASGTGTAALYVLDVATGAKVAKVVPPKAASADDPTGAAAASPNGLSTVAPVDKDGDNSIDYAYAGDLFGNLWRFDFSDPTNISVLKVFATGGKPITSRPQVVRHPTQAGFIVLFGTGSYFQSGEGVPTGQDDQAFYGIWDDLSSKPPGTDSKRTLLSQAVNAEIEEGSYEYRVTSDLAIDWGAHSGWYIPLKSPLHGNLGERQIADSIVRGERVIFTTLLPNPDACGFGGSGWLMELGWVNGGRLPTDAAPFLFRTQVGDTHEYAAVTLDHDGKPGTGKVAPSGRKSSVGIVPTPAVLSRAGAQREFKYLSGSELLAGSQRKVNIEVVNESAESSSAGRRAWSQLFK